MPSNFTENFQLNQWSADDPALHTDFNADNQKIDAALATIPKIVVGSYQGTGEYGKSSPNTLTFSFPPKAVIIVMNRTSELKPGTVFIQGQTASSGIGCVSSSGTNLSLTVQWEGNSVSWYTSSTQADRQLNGSNITYFYLAIG